MVPPGTFEQLQKLERKAAEGELCEEELQVGLQHAYHHVNFAWNLRRISTSEYSNLTQSQFESWGRIPDGNRGTLSRYIHATPAFRQVRWFRRFRVHKSKVPVAD